MMRCPTCSSQYMAGALFCRSCGEALQPAAQRHVATHRAPTNAPAGGAVRPSSPRASIPDRPPLVAPQSLGRLAPTDTVATLHVYIPHLDQRLALPLSGTIRIGRSDPDAATAPELDLSDYDGFDRGVSRHHATVQVFDEGVFMVDQHSSNGTWLGEQPLAAGYAYPLPREATVRFGQLLVHLTLAD